MIAARHLLPAVLAGLTALSAPADAQQLTEAEIAARDKCPMTDAQYQVRPKACGGIFTTAPGKIDTSVGPLTVVDLTAIQLLAAIFITQEDPEDDESFAISTVDDLPNGGIGGRVIASITDGDSRFSTTLPALVIEGLIYIPLSAEAS